jgi:hypothetical protein
MMKHKAWIWMAALLLAPAAWGQANGQATPTAAAGPAQEQGAAKAPAPYGSGETDTVTHADTGLARSFLLLGADFSTRYDDNVRQSNSGRVADTGVLVSPQIAFRHDGGRLRMALSYRPTLLVYQHQTAYNEQDHNLGLDAGYRATPRLSFRARTSVLYRSGLLHSFSDTSVMPALGPPAYLNETVITPFANQFENNSRVDVTFRKSERTTLDLFSTYMRRTFGPPVDSTALLYSTEGKSAGGQYLYALSRRTTVALVYVYEDLHLGPRMKLGLQVPTLALAMKLSPRLHLNVFAGPVHTRLQDTVVLHVSPLVTLVFPVERTDWHWSVGGGFTAGTTRTVFEASASRQVTDGGGLLDAVTSSAVTAVLERQLTRRWRLRWTAGWLRNTTLPTAVLPGEIEGEYGRVMLLHSISESVTAGIGYQYQRQRTTGIAPLGTDFNRNFVYFNLTYRFKNIPLGR